MKPLKYFLYTHRNFLYYLKPEQIICQGFYTLKYKIQRKSLSNSLCNHTGRRSCLHRQVCSRLIQWTTLFIELRDHFSVCWASEAGAASCPPSAFPAVPEAVRPNKGWYPFRHETPVHCQEKARFRLRRPPPCSFFCNFPYCRSFPFPKTSFAKTFRIFEKLLNLLCVQYIGRDHRTSGS